jgi:hypothetical protein
MSASISDGCFGGVGWRVGKGTSSWWPGMLINTCNAQDNSHCHMRITWSKKIIRCGVAFLDYSTFFHIKFYIIIQSKYVSFK